MSFLRRQLEDPGRLARIKRWSVIALVFIAAAEIGLPILFGGGHPHFDFESFPAFGSIYGLISCMVIIIGSKWIGKLGIMRPEDPKDD